MRGINSSLLIHLHFSCCGTPPFFFNDRGTAICQWIIFTVACQAIDLFGIATNIINIICFVKQGFKDPVNITLSGLAVADLGCLTTLVWLNVCNTPSFYVLDLPFHTLEFQHMTGGMPHAIFARVSGWITALITLERCLCITAPLKVKGILTPKRVSILVSSVFILLIASASPFYIVNRLGMKFYPRLNKTLMGIISTNNREIVENVSFTINNMLIPGIAFCIITCCTITLVYRLQKRTKWREKSTRHTQADNVSKQNKRVAKMIVIISTLFITCYIPVCVLFLGMVVEPHMSLEGNYKNALILYAGLCFLLESINSSSNVFIYYHMSTKYRRCFQKLFRFHEDESVI